MVENVGNKKGLDVTIKSKEKFEVMDDEKVLPYVFEISMAIDRSLYSILEHCLQEDAVNFRILLSLKTLLGSNSGWSVVSCKKGWSEGKTDYIYQAFKRK